jgi:hypothetical protein
VPCLLFDAAFPWMVKNTRSNLNKETGDGQSWDFLDEGGGGANLATVGVAQPLVVVAPVDPRDLAANILADVEIGAGGIDVRVVQTNEGDTLQKITHKIMKFPREIFA